MKFELNNLVDEGKIDLTSVDIDNFVESIEDDARFYDKLDDFLSVFIEEHGDEYDL
jgi:hypothetical protein